MTTTETRPTIQDIASDPDMKIYFNFTANVLLPIYTHAADNYLILHRETIRRIARKVLDPLDCYPKIIYRGIILRDPITHVDPHPNFQYLSFSEDENIAEHFADVNGFGSDIVDVTKQLGTYGYIIQYTPAPHEILFHHCLLDCLPYVEAFNRMGMDGEKEVEGLKRQQEVVIIQPDKPLTNIRKF